MLMKGVGFSGDDDEAIIAETMKYAAPTLACLHCFCENPESSTDFQH
jgi:hypothetical protein